jgi:CDGSH-type Zn-finger protein
MTVKIQLMKAKSGDGGGPLKVEGDFQILDLDGAVIEHKGEAAMVCRCGASANKPFCDGAHAKVGFKG